MAEYTPYPVEVVTPEGFAFEGDAQIVVAPGAAGELGVLANHAPLVTLLQPGETRVTDAEGHVHRYATDDGFMQVRKNRALVLVGEAVNAEEIDAGQARSRLEEAERALQRARDGDGDTYRCEREVRFAEALVKVASS